MKYRCVKSFMNSNGSNQYWEGDIISEDKYKSLPYWYRNYFEPFEEVSNARVIGDIYVKNKQ